MPKGQRSGKEAKKPKKDQSPGKPISPDAVTPTIHHRRAGAQQEEEMTRRRRAAASRSGRRHASCVG